MSIVIVGPGALGSVLGAALHRGGEKVTLLGRPSAHVAAIQERGLHLSLRDGSTATIPLEVTADPSVAATAETVIVLVKSYDTAAAMRSIRPSLRPGTIVLTLQNGLGNAQTARDQLGPGPRILQGVTSQSATRLAPGDVAHTGVGPTLIGYGDEVEEEIAARLAQLFAAAGLPAAAVSDIERWTWHKTALNAAINGLTALGDFPNGAIADDERLLAAAEIIAKEAAAVARAQGVELGAMRKAILDTCRATADNRSSMLQDIDAGRQTEVDAIHGAILTAGEAAGILTPAVQVLDALLRARTRAHGGTQRWQNGRLARPIAPN